MAFHLLIPQNLALQIVDHALQEQPLECCGFLAGKRSLDEKGVVQGWFPLTNIARSPIRFDADPRDLFQATREMDRLGWQLLAIYHSHPTSAPIPSRTDLERSYSPDVMNLIISLQNERVETRGWWLDGDSYKEATWEIVDCNQPLDSVHSSNDEAD